MIFAGCFMLALGRSDAWPAMQEGHGGRGGGGFGAGHVGIVPPLRSLGRPRFAVRRFGHRFARGRHDHGGFFPSYYPYFDGYGFDEDYDTEAPDARAPRRQHSGYCEVSSHVFPQNCVWKDGP